jgi:hypothetical protein
LENVLSEQLENTTADDEVEDAYEGDLGDGARPRDGGGDPITIKVTS